MGYTLYVGWLIRHKGLVHMTIEEYKEMYRENCLEGGFAMSSEGFAEFVAYRKRVEKYFEKMKDSS